MYKTNIFMKTQPGNGKSTRSKMANSLGRDTKQEHTEILMVSSIKVALRAYLCK